MRFKSNKEDLRDKIQSSIYGVYSPSSDFENIKYAVENIINAKITAAFDALINDLYTDADFERDMGL